MTDRVRKEAADMLACLASQPWIGRSDIEAWAYTTYDLPGKWTAGVRPLARRALGKLIGDGYWREMYAEAEARLREGGR